MVDTLAYIRIDALAYFIHCQLLRLISFKLKVNFKEYKIECEILIIETKHNILNPPNVTSEAPIYWVNYNQYV